MGRGKDVLFVLPLYSSYQYKDVSQKLLYDRKVREWYDAFTACGFRVNCFAEDMLAVELLKDEDISWVSIVSSADRFFILHNMGEYPEAYRTIQAEPARQSFIRAAANKYKKPIRGEHENEYDYNTRYANVLRQRMRNIANSSMKDFGFVVYFDANNNYCNKPVPMQGDGLGLVEIREFDQTESYSFGGMQVAESLFKKIMESV